jgi:hypothetical protein
MIEPGKEPIDQEVLDFRRERRTLALRKRSDVLASRRERKALAREKNSEVLVSRRERRASALRKRVHSNKGLQPRVLLSSYGLVEFKIAATGPGSSLSAFFNSKLTCHISASERT